MIPISLPHLALSFLPLVAVAVVLWRWSIPTRTLGWATLRMVLQLFLIGYVLTFVFDAEHPLVVVVVLGVMLTASSLIALRPLERRRPGQYRRAFLAIAGAGFATLAVVIAGVLDPPSWFEPRTLVPIAGMIFSNAMNAVSLAAERYAQARSHGAAPLVARREALETALIPMLNSFFAVGLVALPGMMTGQILSGVAPHLAVRYQVMVMCMTLGAAGLAAAGYLAQEARADADEGAG
ncbi:MAG: ABC transporter permease [Gammaproteobacteria bacterium]|nr:ABC transporter permease [Gammaproteobacteria bacterium]